MVVQIKKNDPSAWPFIHPSIHQMNVKAQVCSKGRNPLELS